MKNFTRKNRKWHFALLAVGLLLGLLIVLKRDTMLDSIDSSNARTVVQNAADKSAEPRKSRSIQPTDPRLKLLFDPEFSLASHEEILHYLEKSGVSPASLSTAYYVTLNQDYLEELKKIARGSTIALSTLASELVSPLERLSYAKQLSALEPRNALGPLLEFAAATEIGDATTANNALDAALTLDSLDLHAKEKELNQREAWQIMKNCSSLESRLRASEFANAQKLAPAQIQAGLKAVYQGLSEKGTPDDLLSFATPVLKITRLLDSGVDSNDKPDPVEALVTETVLLRMLPAETG